jgi:hypothetical protein
VPRDEIRRPPASRPSRRRGPAAHPVTVLTERIDIRRPRRSLESVNHAAYTLHARDGAERGLKILFCEAVYALNDWRGAWSPLPAVPDKCSIDEILDLLEQHPHWFVPRGAAAESNSRNSYITTDIMATRPHNWSNPNGRVGSQSQYFSGGQGQLFENQDRDLGVSIVNQCMIGKGFAPGD